MLASEGKKLIFITKSILLKQAKLKQCGFIIETNFKLELVIARIWDSKIM